MGQQQLLLLTLAIVLVGVAVALGIDAYMQNRRQAEADIMVNNLVRLAATAQEWKLKPASFGGGNGRDGYNGVETGFDQLGWPTVPWNITARNPDGTVTREAVQCYRPNPNVLYCPVPQYSGSRGDGRLFIYALSNLITGTGNTISSSEMNLIATAVVNGTNPEDIQVTVVR